MSSLDDLIGAMQAAEKAKYPGVTRPDYVQEYDPAKMSLTDYLAGKYDHSGYDKYKAEAMRSSPSAWAMMAKQDQAAKTADARDKGAGQAGAATAQAMDQIAARGGLSSGARERTAQEGEKNYLAMSQGLTRDENLNDLQIGMNDEQNRIQQLSTVPGMEQSQAQMWTAARDKDIGNITAENDRRNRFNMDLYKEKMTEQGANKQADATANAGKK